MLCRKFKPIRTSIFQVTTIFKNGSFLEAIAHGFFQKMAPKSPKIFITFSYTYDVLMLCSKFELIPTSIFRVTVIFKNEPKSEKITVL